MEMPIRWVAKLRVEGVIDGQNIQKLDRNVRRAHAETFVILLRDQHRPSQTDIDLRGRNAGPRRWDIGLRGCLPGRR
jgi:hypothetical protein